MKTSSNLYLVCFLFLGFGIYFQITGNEIESRKYDVAVSQHEKKENEKILKGESVFTHSFHYDRRLNWAEYLAILSFITSGAIFLVMLWTAHPNMRFKEKKLELFGEE